MSEMTDLGPTLTSSYCENLINRIEHKMVANAKIPRGLIQKTEMFDSTESISRGNIFFSQNHLTAIVFQKKILPKIGCFETPRKPPRFSLRRSKWACWLEREGSSSDLSKTTMNSSSTVSQ
ncbi:hypothetical protein SLA2020_515000 [Shorea laevis]